MNAKKRSLIALLCLLLLVSGCKNASRNEETAEMKQQETVQDVKLPVCEPEPVIYEETITPISSFTGIEVSPAQVVSGELQLSIANHSDGIFDLTYAWSFEKKVDGEWYRLKMREDVVPVDWLIHFEPGVSRTITLFLKHYDAEAVEDGEYRFVLMGGWGDLTQLVEIPVMIEDADE